LLINSQDEGAITAAMDRLLADKSLRQTLSEAGLKQAAKFSWPGMAKKLAALYEKVLQEK
jgi:alpha-1,3-rhamnosyl/mannosyltransferase